MPEQPKMPSSKTGIPWVEDQILAKLTRSGPSTFMVLAAAIGVQWRNVGFALSRLVRSGAVMVGADTPYPVYSLATGAGATRTPGQSQADQVSGETSAPVVPAKPRRRGRPKGYLPGSVRSLMCRDILAALVEYGHLTYDDLFHVLGVQPAWLRGPLERLLELGQVAQTPVVILGKDRRPKPIVLFHLPGQTIDSCERLRDLVYAADAAFDGEMLDAPGGAGDLGAHP